MKDWLKSKTFSQIIKEDAQVNPAGDTVNILVIVDMQKEFLEHEAPVPLMGRVVDKIEKFKSAGGKIIALCDTHDEDYLLSSEGIKVPVPHAIRGTEGRQIADEILAVLPEDAAIFDKYTFASLELVNEIGKYVERFGQRHTAVEFVGMLTDVCVINNALLLKAFFYETNISVDLSCCCGSSQTGEEAAIKIMDMSLIELKR